MASNARVQVRGKNWTKKTTIDAKKFDIVSKAMLASLSNEPVTYTKLVEQVTNRLSGFDGSIA
ncbi:MAG TPA: hypothetical protein P5528_03650 [Steroidobacteraceae bacterium]|nr:hypothetical protein [Steroidobacteraceae bacterium]